MNYKDLEVWQIARELSIEIHKMTLPLTKFEMYEGGSQIRRSSKSIRSTIVEGYSRRRYKNEFIKFITYAIASTDETLTIWKHFLKLNLYRIKNFIFIF